MVSWTALVVGLVAAAVLAAVVYRDAERAELTPPIRWAAIVFATTTVGVATYAFVPSVPVPGLLVVVVAGPAIYLFERDDAAHEDTADPTMLPNQPREESGEEE